jgi:hypothetical protein
VFEHEINRVVIHVFLLQHFLELVIDYSLNVPATFHKAIQTAIHASAVQIGGEIALNAPIICPASELHAIRTEPFLKFARLMYN